MFMLGWHLDISPSSLQESGSIVTLSILVYSQGFKGTKGVEVRIQKSKESRVMLAFIQSNLNPGAYLTGRGPSFSDPEAEHGQ